MTTWLIDKSALVRLHAAPNAEIWARRIERGTVWISTPTLLEQGYSAKSAADWDSVMHGSPVCAMPVALLSPRAEARAIEVQGHLARRGHHRAPSVSDLLIAAIAEAGNLTVLHLDSDFELIADVTGQPIERLDLGQYGSVA